jgi:lysophospholipase L1-like esterase
MEDVNRREFLLTSASLSAMACGSGDHSSKNQITGPNTPPLTLPTGATILFQGDSIPNADRSAGSTDANNADCMGYGFALFIAMKQLYANPNQGLQFYNRSFGGDTVPLLQARWQTDTIDIKPDLLSILVGINDFANDYQDPNVATIYEQNYTALINSTLQALPNVKLVIMEPYIIADAPVPGFQAIRDAAAQVAQQANAIFVPLQDMLNQHISQQTATYWVKDQAHPTIAGHAAIAYQWLQYVGW